MASPAPTATLCQLARQGWPLLVAVLLTLLLGWSALHEGRGGDPPPTAGRHTLKICSRPCRCRPRRRTNARSTPHQHRSRRLMARAPRPAPDWSPRAALVAHIPLWRSDALRWQLHDPALRLNPGHAPPAPHAS
jgi:hypothetical protein